MSTSSLSDTRSAELYRRALHVLPGGSSDSADTDWFLRAWESDPLGGRGWISRLTLDLLRQEAQIVLKNALGLKPDVPRRAAPGQS